MKIVIATVIAIAAIAACSPQRPDNAIDASGTGGDGAPSGGDGGGGSDGLTSVYAHTGDQLYRVDPDTLAVTLVGAFAWPDGGQDEMTDLAIDSTGLMVGVSMTNVYRVDPTTAATVRLNAIGDTFNGLSFVPASAVGGAGSDVLVGTEGGNDNVVQIDPTTGVATVIGHMGGSYTSSGDLVGVAGFGVVQTVPGDPDDVLVKLAPSTFTATPIGTGTGYSEIYGVAFWKNKIFGFTSGGDFITIDPTTGVGTLVQHTDQMWYGAAVTTVAPVIE